MPELVTRQCRQSTHRHLCITRGRIKTGSASFPRMSASIHFSCRRPSPSPTTPRMPECLPISTPIWPPSIAASGMMAFILGPTKVHGPVTGVVLRHGYLVAEWGEPERVDMTFSITKSFLSTVAGLAWDRGLIRDVQDRVKDYVDDGGFDSPHNAQITWDHFLRQTNEWETFGISTMPLGTRTTTAPAFQPGTYYEYNDVRVNRFSLSLLHVWRRPLPEVLKELVMDPINASIPGNGMATATPG